MSLEQTVDNLEIRYANAVTFVGTSNTMIDTTTGRIQTKGIQHNSNVITDISGPHGRVAPTLKKYPEIVFDDTSKMDTGEGGTTSGLIFKQAGYTVTASSTHSSNGRVPYRAFNGDHTTGWICDSGSWNSGTNVYQGGRGIGGYDGEWIKLELPHKIKVETMYIEADLHSGRRPLTGKLLGSDDDSSWAIIKDLTSIPNQNKNTLNIGSTVAYKYIAFLTETIPNGHDTVWIDEIEYYGYEEYTPAGDHSVDTTFMSRFNNPQLTGVQVLVDGATGQGTNQISGGPDPSGNQSTMTSPNKYWTLNGTLTSNLSVEANTFLEGDQPHAVSVWFNSSNLEANVSNTCVFSVSDQEHLNSENLDLQSNTWHNLTYAYQGEGGSRVTYLDGRKVSEDQAEDTFGEYPPFAMTGYSQGGYVVSASSLRSGHEGWHAFDKTKYAGGAGEKWASEASQGDTFTGGDSLYNGTNRLSSSTQPGAWLKIELPYKLRLQYMSLFSDPTTEQPEDFIIYGSNDDNTWDQLFQKTGATANTDYVNYTINSVSCYKYFALVVRRLISSTTIAAIDEWKLYGHRENDLVRLPDPTNVLKYPHIAMTGPAQRGYVASSSGTHTNGNHPVFKVFDGDITNDWQINGGRYSLSSGVYSHNAGESTVTNVQARFGDWVQLESPHKIRVKTMKFTPRPTYGQERSPATGVLLGSNDNGSTWTEIKLFDVTADGTPNSYTAGSSTTLAIDSGSNSTPGYYKIHRLIWLTLYTASQTTYADRASVADLEFYGTGVDSVPIQIGGGNIDKVANFRVYDKFVGEDQALEIWDAQKDEFGRAKSSMTLQKGRLGIGTDEPQGRLAVADEPHNLEEFPPRAMTDYKTYFEGHGEFCVSSGDPDTSDAWSSSTGLGNLFDKDTTQADTRYYRTSGASFDLGSPGYYAGSNSIGGIYGAWVRIDFPYRAKIQSMNILTRSDEYNGRAPRDGYLLGRNNDEDEWTIIHEWTEALYYQFIERKFTIEASKYYSSYALVATRLLSAAETDTNSTNLSRMNISEWRLFGTREQGQSVLHDGELTLTKSLNVPRIGPALDADDTPRRDRLVVEYNTSTNPTFEGAVRDTSGRGLDANLRDATYNAIEKSIRVGTSQDIILEQGIPGKSGDVTNVSYSIWIKADGVTATNQIIMTQISSYAVGVGLTLALNTNELQFGFGYAYSSGNQIGGAVVNAIAAGKWYHIVAIKKGSGTLNATTLPDILEIYINGEKETLSHGGGTGTLNIGVNNWLVIGAIRKLLSGRTAEEFIGDVSSIKYYDTALTAEEVKTLYDMGRTGSVANPQPLHIAAPLYSPGTIVQVEQAVKTDTQSTTSTSPTDVSGLGVTIHPKFSNSKIIVSYQVNMGGNYHMFLRVFRTQNGVQALVGTGDAAGNRPPATSYQSHLSTLDMRSMNMEFLDSANGTDAIEYKVQFWVAHVNYTACINQTFTTANNAYYAFPSSSITVKEVCQ